MQIATGSPIGRLDAFRWVSHVAHGLRGEVAYLSRSGGLGMAMAATGERGVDAGSGLTQLPIGVRSAVIPHEAGSVTDLAPV